MELTIRTKIDSENVDRVLKAVETFAGLKAEFSISVPLHDTEQEISKEEKGDLNG